MSGQDLYDSSNEEYTQTPAFSAIPPPYHPGLKFIDYNQPLL